MTEHFLQPGHDTVVDVFDPHAAAVLMVEPGDSVEVRSLNAHGHIERQTKPGEQVATLLRGSRGHTLTGPIGVRGARPGQILAVRPHSLTPDDWGFTVSGARDNELNRRLGITGELPAWLLWDLDVEAKTGTDDRGHTVALAPFLGVTGVPPAEPGRHSTIPPRTVGGGNIDCRELVAGSTLYLPVTVADALLSVGDGHAAQGDGEVSGTAIETGMTTRMTLDLLDEAAVSGVHAETPAGRITFGFNADLNIAMADALAAMADWMQSIYRLDRSTTLALASPTVSLRVTQVANDTWGVHALLPEGAIR